jgi:glutamyl-tRNA synthetase
MNVVTRFAPSPTGLFHAGSYRTALFAYIFARQHDGKFILRIEDTDKERSKKEYEDNILDSLKWLGLDFDGQIFRQSERTEIYKKYIKKLIEAGHAYVSKEDPSSNNQGPNEPILRNEVIRFRNPKKKVVFNDLIRGRIEFDTTELGDFVVAKSLDEPVFHLVNVVDDYEMGITHIIRGEDHISNTPRQILIFEALGVKPPEYAHIPLLLASDRSKLSKRHGALPVSEYRDRGYLPQALLNYMALLGWHPADDKEMLTLPEIIKSFSLDRVQKSGAIFDEEKFRWYNRQYLVELSDEQFVADIKSFVPDWLSSDTKKLERLTPLLREKINAFGEIKTMLEPGGDLNFIQSLNNFSPELLLWKKNPSNEKAAVHLKKVAELLGALTDDAFTPEQIKSSLWSYAEAEGKGDVLWPLRVALTGQEKSPDPFVSASVLGKEETLTRIDQALAKLKK